VKQITVDFQQIADAGKVKLDVDATNEILKVFHLLYGSVQIGGVSRWGSQAIPRKDLRSVQVGFKRIAQSFQKASKVVRSAVAAQPGMTDFAHLKAHEIIAALDDAAAVLEDEARSVEGSHRSKTRGRIGYPALALSVESLYSIYRQAGGKRRYTQGKNAYTYGGEAVEFILATLEQIAPMLPEAALPPKQAWRNYIGEALKASRKSQRTRRKPLTIASK
jgi:hypothetical protein